MLENQDNLLIICPNDTKIQILQEICQKKILINIKFMDIDTFIENYFYKYDNKTVSYIMNKYNTNIDISKMYLEKLYVIDLEKKYKSKKIIFLQELKKDLIKKELLYTNDYFKDYIKEKNIKIINYPKLEKYLIDTLKKLNAQFIDKEYKKREFTVVEANDIFEEVTFVIENIIDLYKNKIPLNKIFIININDDYNYTIEYLFKMFNIPINIENKNSIASTLIVKKYLNDNTLPELTSKNEELINKIISIKNSLIDLENDSNYNSFFKNSLENTYLPAPKYKNAVNITNIFTRNFNDDEYVFVLNFNDSIIPIMYKDEEFITDNDKNEVNLFTTSYKNKREKEITINYLSNIKNITLSYKLNSFKDKFYPSSMINDYNMKVKKYEINNYNISHKYNKRMLSTYLDRYYKYKEENKHLKSLYKTYKETLEYNTYNNKFTGIDKKIFLDKVDKITLSYTSMNTYNQCKFKYYVNYILNLDPFNETFYTLIGNLFHYILEKCFSSNFNFENTWNGYLEDKELLIKEKFFLEKLKKNLINVIDIIKEQIMYTDFKKCYYEKKIYIPLEDNEIKASFIGKIDKIMYYNSGNNDYFSVIDYKTGSFDSKLYDMKYGLSMQLATYLYLINKSNIFRNPKFGGMYFQKVLMGNVSYDLKKTYIEKMKDSLKLVGYSTDNEEILKYLDHEYTNSKIIKSMKKTDKGFSRYAKILTNDEVNNIINYTEKVIYDSLKSIKTADFDVNPKRIDNIDVSCTSCKYKDLCYRKEEDYINLEKCEDLSFLEGDHNGK